MLSDAKVSDLFSLNDDKGKLMQLFCYYLQEVYASLTIANKPQIFSPAK